MSKSRRILSALLSVLMVLTMLPFGMMGTVGAVSAQGEISTQAIDSDQGLLDMPDITISSTAIIRTAESVGSQAIGTTVVKATASGLPEISSDYADAFYAGETPSDPMVVFTTDKALKSQPTVNCTNATLTFTAVQSGEEASGRYTYSWIVSGSNVSVKQLNFVVGYTYEYTDVNGKTVEKTYTAYTTSAVENVAQPGGIEADRYRSWNLTAHACDRKETAHYIFRVVGTNTFGTYADADNTSGWSRGYYDFVSNSFVTVSNAAALGYSQVNFDSKSSDGTQDTNTSYDQNRPVSITYIDRSIVNLEKYNLRVTVSDLTRRTDKYSEYKMEEFKVLEGAVAYDENSYTSAAATNELGITATAPIDTTAGGTVTIPMKGSLYTDGFTDLENGNKTKSYTFVVSFGAKYNHITRARSAVSLQLISYDKSELRADLDDIYRMYAPTQLYAADSEIGNNPNAWFYSSGWNEYLSALQTAEYVLNDPDTDQNTIDAADAALKTAVANLVVAEADYTEANVLIDEVKSYNSLIYTDASWSRVQTAVSNIKSGISVFNQTYLDSLVADLRTAISQLEKTLADYTDVNTMVKIYEQYGEHPEYYTAESWKNLRDTVTAVDYTLTVDKQDLVDAYAKSIDAAIKALVPASADYSAINALIPRYEAALAEKDYYTPLTWRSVNAAYNSIEWDLIWSQQEDVDDYATNLENALNRLKYQDADYTKLEEALESAEEEVEAWYTPDSWAPFAEALEAADTVANASTKLNIKQQSQIDELAENLTKAQGLLEDADGDYTAVENAIELAETYDQSKYTAESWQTVENAIDAVVYNLPAKQQSTIDGYAKAITDALNNLKEPLANYDAVNAIIAEWQDMDKSLYTAASILKVSNEVDAVNWELPKSQQTTVDGYVTKIREAMNNLEYLPANYDAVNVALGKANEAKAKQESFAAERSGYSYYTISSYNNLLMSMNYNPNLDIREQATVDGYATAINNALNGLEYNTGDYSKVTAAIERIPADLEQEGVYEADSAAEVLVAKMAIVEGLSTEKQATIDKYAEDLNTAIDNLKKVELADYSKVRAAEAAAKEAIKDTNYTDESIKAVQNALDAVVEGLLASEQTRVDGFATAINEAVKNLTDKPLDLSSYNTVSAKKPTSLDKFTDDSVSAYNDAFEAVESYKTNNNSIRNQAAFEELVSALDTAIANLKTKTADYSAVVAAKTNADATAQSGYCTEASVEAYNALIATINWELTIDDQATVDGYAAAIKAFAFEYLDADYSKLDAAIKAQEAEIAKGYFTDASVSEFNALVAGFDRTLNITKQATVDGYTSSVENFAFAYKPSDFSKIDALYTEISLYDSSLYENYDEIFYGYIFGFYAGEVQAAKTTYTKISDQPEVDKLYTKLVEYKDMLILAGDEPQQASYELINGASLLDSKYIIGLNTGLTTTAFVSGYIKTENATVTVKNIGRYVGTGSVVTITNSLNGEKMAEFTVLIYGDVSGDGQINANDLTYLSSYINSSMTFDTVQTLAANVNGDRYINALDYVHLNEVVQNQATLNQTTGKVN